MNPQSIFDKRRLAIAAGATLAAGFLFTGPAQASTASASVANDTLTIRGTGGDDAISVALDAGDPNALVVGFGNGTVSQTFDRNTFNSITVFLRGGDDHFQVIPGGGTLADEALNVIGGEGNDTIVGGDGNDRLSGGTGDDNIQGAGGTDLIFGNAGQDSVNGNVGNDTEFLGRGQDQAVWNPGEGSDVVSGGDGLDTLTFNGSDSNETMSLSANGRDVVFLRDPGAVRMDLDRVEQFDLAALGGADTLTVDNLAGTDLRFANIDLGSQGVGDHQVDAVTVNGTGRADQIDVDADSGSVNVAGLRAETRIAGSETTDQLVVNSLGGNDEVDVNDAARALINVEVNLGTGQR